jgi:hypothetical protein
VVRVGVDGGGGLNVPRGVALRITAALRSSVGRLRVYGRRALMSVICSSTRGERALMRAVSASAWGGGSSERVFGATATYEKRHAAVRTTSRTCA